MRICVFGAGAIGGNFATRLAAAGNEVSVVARGAHLEAIRARGLTLLAGWHVASWIIQGMLVAAFSLLVFGKFCLGAYFFHVLRGEATFANRTLPWARN